MTGRRTGATSEQIEAAAKRWWDVHHEDDPEGWANWDDDRDYLMADTHNEATYIIPETDRIISVSDLQLIIDFYDYAIQHTDYRDIEMYDRITALIGGKA